MSQIPRSASFTIHKSSLPLAALLDSGARLDAICKETFPLPLLQEHLIEKRLELHKGCGLVVFRGIDPSRYSRRENIIIFAGLSSHLSEQRGRQTRTKYLGTPAQFPENGRP